MPTRLESPSLTARRVMQELAGWSSLIFTTSLVKSKSSGYIECSKHWGTHLYFRSKWPESARGSFRDQKAIGAPIEASRDMANQRLASFLRALQRAARWPTQLP